MRGVILKCIILSSGSQTYARAIRPNTIVFTNFWLLAVAKCGTCGQLKLRPFKFLPCFKWYTTCLSIVYYRPIEYECRRVSKSVKKEIFTIEYLREQLLSFHTNQYYSSTIISLHSPLASSISLKMSEGTPRRC